MKRGIRGYLVAPHPPKPEKRMAIEKLSEIERRIENGWRLKDDMDAVTQELRWWMEHGCRPD